MQDVLQEVLGFSEADLQANRAGTLSAAQQGRLARRQARSLKILIGTAVSLVCLLGLAFISGGLGMIAFSIIALILAVLALVEYLVGYVTYTRDLNSAEIETIQGVLAYVWRRDSVMGVEDHPAGIRVGDMQFLLMEDQARAFIEGEVYALHVAPATHTLLSAERVHLGDSPQEDGAAARDWVTDHATRHASGGL